MPGPPSDDRALFESEALDLYDAAVAENGFAETDPRVRRDGHETSAFALLVRMGLLQKDPEGDRWRPVEPSVAQARVVAPLTTEGARLLEESAHWSKLFQQLATTFRAAPSDDSGGAFTYLHGDAIEPYLSSLVTEATSEILTAQPQAGRNPATVASAVRRDTAALERGVAMRILYQHSARRHASTHKYVEGVSARGAEVRTLDEFFNRMIVIDRRVAVIPGPEGTATAVFVREPAILAFLIDIFERTWARGRPFASRENNVARAIAAEQRRMTIRMLIEGHSDAISARRLGVSARTYAGYVADLRAEYDAATRFQLGYLMGRRGISGDEPTDH
ncbi:MAG TPA: LuxR family transcriptional regulator [Nocardioides sp.]|nr:LuxR family transcriptional regulator [Nocardioides sp.]